jgi:hypothetical protein
MVCISFAVWGLQASNDLVFTLGSRDARLVIAGSAVALAEDGPMSFYGVIILRIWVFVFTTVHDCGVWTVRGSQDLHPLLSRPTASRALLPVHWSLSREKVVNFGQPRLRHRLQASFNQLICTSSSDAHRCS